MITLSEDTRRMQDMMKMYSMHGMGMDPSMFGGSETLVLNANNALVNISLNTRIPSMYRPSVNSSMTLL